MNRHLINRRVNEATRRKKIVICLNKTQTKPNEFTRLSEWVLIHCVNAQRRINVAVVVVYSLETRALTHAHAVYDDVFRSAGIVFIYILFAVSVCVCMRAHWIKCQREKERKKTTVLSFATLMKRAEAAAVWSKRVEKKTSKQQQQQAKTATVIQQERRKKQHKSQLQHSNTVKAFEV